MFRVYFPERNDQVFTQIDPRQDGCRGDVEEGVDLDYSDYVHIVGQEDRPDGVIGLLAPKTYKVFKYEWQRREAGARPIMGNVKVAYCWADYLRNKLASYDNSRHERN